jgi:hypothetical protein
LDLILTVVSTLRAAAAYPIAGMVYLINAVSHDPFQCVGAVFGIAGSYLLAENRSWSRYAWPLWLASNVALIVYFTKIHAWAVLTMQAFYLLSSIRGCWRAFARSAS